jgi:hypothetical protein
MLTATWSPPDEPKPGAKTKKRKPPAKVLPALDLRAIANNRYRLSRDPSAAIVPQDEEDRAWLARVLCRHGWIGINSETELASYCAEPQIRRHLLRLEGAKLRQDGDRECLISIPAAGFDEAARLLRARRKRQLTDEERARRKAAMVALRLRPLDRS